MNGYFKWFIYCGFLVIEICLLLMTNEITNGYLEHSDLGFILGLMLGSQLTTGFFGILKKD